VESLDQGRNLGHATMTMAMARTEGTESEEQDRGLIEIYDDLQDVRSQTKYQTS